MATAPQKAPMTRAEKLVWYAGQLMTDADKYEKEKDPQTAISKYLQAADILLLLSKSEERYNVWKYYTDKATFCHQKVRTLIALAPKPE